MEILHRVIVGAGVLGAALAHAFRGRGETLVLEQAERIATGMSSRNSGVIHAGLYYPAESLKLKYCLRGAELLYAFAAAQGVSFRKTGKYLVANGADELAQLEVLREHAGAGRLVRAAVPDGVRADGALFSPQSGIVDPHGLVQALFNASDATLLFGQKVTALKAEGALVRVELEGEVYWAREVFNCAGLAAARFVAGYRHAYARGSYFQLRVPPGLELPALVYPAVPKKAASLGIHLTQNVWGEAFLGPDLEWLEQEDYSVDPARLAYFLHQARSYLPWLQADMLQPAYAGIRPKLDRSHFSDFTIVAEGASGQLRHCLGIESPGLTASMGLAEALAGA